MTNKEKLAREWAEKTWTMGDKRVRAAKDFILANTKPPTMADVQWDNHEHRGMVGVGEDGTWWVMVDMRPDRRIVGVTTDFKKVRGLRPEWLTPTGKRYKLVDITDKPEPGPEPEHPKTLHTVEDFENAPSGTIVTRVSQLPVTKFCGEWRSLFSNDTPTRMADLGPWEVLRWGWTK